jgi:hypothetical protein
LYVEGTLLVSIAATVAASFVWSSCLAAIVYKVSNLAANSIILNLCGLLHVNHDWGEVDVVASIDRRKPVGISGHHPLFCDWRNSWIIP